MAKSRRRDRRYAVELKSCGLAAAVALGFLAQQLHPVVRCSTCATFAWTPHLTPSWMGHPPS